MGPRQPQADPGPISPPSGLPQFPSSLASQWLPLPSPTQTHPTHTKVAKPLGLPQMAAFSLLAQQGWKKIGFKLAV
jgi:hypothetical protein